MVLENSNPASNITDFRYTCRVFKSISEDILWPILTNQKINVDRKDIAGVTMSEKNKPFTSFDLLLQIR